LFDQFGVGLAHQGVLPQGLLPHGLDFGPDLPGLLAGLAGLGLHLVQLFQAEAELPPARPGIGPPPPVEKFHRQRVQLIEHVVEEALELFLRTAELAQRTLGGVQAGLGAERSRGARRSRVRQGNSACGEIDSHGFPIS
jgi:hypothetical protein